MNSRDPAVSVCTEPSPQAPGESATDLRTKHRTSTHGEQHAETRNGILCVLAVAAAILATIPIAETGFQDDWSYIRTAYDFARTGHFVYNGWTTAMLGWIIPWSALFIKLFGFSFTLVRATMLPFALASVYLFHASLVHFGIRGRSAVLGALTFGLSPLFLPLAASYMTDVPSMFVIVLCLYLCQRAVAATSDRAAILWLCFAAATNVLGGTVRQIAWLGALVMVPGTAWFLRRRPGILATAAALWLASIAAIAAALRWWNHQPYSVPEHIDQGRVTFLMTHHMLGAITKGFFSLLLLIFPVLACWFAPKRFRTRAAVVRLALWLAAGTLGIVLVQHFIPDAWIMPWLTHMIQAEMRGSGEFHGVVQISWPVWVRELISIAVVSAAALCIDQWIFQKRSPGTSSNPSRKREIFWLLAPFSFAYISLLAPRALYALIYDRYFLGLMPVAIIVLLRLFQRRNHIQVPAVAFVVLAAYTLFGIAGTHDWYAVLRARLAAINEVHATGIPYTRIQGAFEFDGWTEIDAAGHINEERIEYPAGAYQKNMRMYHLPIQCWHFFGWYSPAIHPLYVVSATPDACFDPSTFPAVNYRKWLPPFHGVVYVRKWKERYE